jgi:hypothetical protein
MAKERKHASDQTPGTGFPLPGACSSPQQRQIFHLLLPVPDLDVVQIHTRFHLLADHPLFTEYAFRSTRSRLAQRFSDFHERF